MNVMMMFPKTVDEFMEQYKIVDSDNVYSNGMELVPIFRMKQWFEHIDAVPVVRCKDCKHRDTINCGMQFYGNDDDGHLCKSDDGTQNDGYCYWGERKDV